MDRNYDGPSQPPGLASLVARLILGFAFAVATAITMTLGLISLPIMLMDTPAPPAVSLAVAAAAFLASLAGLVWLARGVIACARAKEGT